MDASALYEARFSNLHAGGALWVILSRLWSGWRGVLTAYRSPWQNGYVERLIGTIRRDCLDHVIVLNRRHLKRLLADYFAYYHRWRTHLSLDMDKLEGRPVEETDKVVEIDELGGLHHHYERQAA